ncbi:TolC family protein [Poseidonibacter antarcticus]|uniref:TolC family protein n=1 Tax=Poseidonibacter antarcticus TaxID=2478538 RepID=UPI0013CE9874|nr:TolC family protein [Poseidonibacter antarcticus]
MRKKLFLFTLIILASFSLANAQTIDNIIENTFKNNYSLKALEESIKSTKEQIALSSKWQNPVLTFGINDIQFDDVSKRDLEAMQSQFIGFSQIVPIGEKLQRKEKIAINDYQISKYLLEEKKLQYKSKIYEYIYKEKLLEEKLALFQEFKSNTLKLEELLTKLYKYNKATQIQIINTQVLYQELNLKSQKLQTLLNTINLNLEEITYEKIKNINIDTKIKKIKLLTNINSHPKILSLIQSSKKQDNISILEKEKKNSDIKVSLNYFQRDEKYEDYVNIAFAIPLSLRGSEDIKSKQAKIKTIEINHNIQDLKSSFKNKIKILQETINDSIITLDIINNKILPKFNQLQKVLESYNSLQKIDSKSLINNLNEIIKYKLEVINQKDKYFSAIAKSIYFTKEI